MSVDPVGIVDVARSRECRRPGEHVVGRVPGPLAWAVGRSPVWDCLCAGGITSGCPSVMLYLDDTPRVEVGVLLRRSGRSRSSRALHRAVRVCRDDGPPGPFSGIGQAHDAVLRWCHEHSLTVTPTRWEIYGPHREDPEQQWTQVDWLLA